MTDVKSVSRVMDLIIRDIVIQFIVLSKHSQLFFHFHSVFGEVCRADLQCTLMCGFPLHCLHFSCFLQCSTETVEMWLGGICAAVQLF